MGVRSDHHLQVLGSHPPSRRKHQEFSPKTFVSAPKNGTLPFEGEDRSLEGECECKERGVLEWWVEEVVKVLEAKSHRVSMYPGNLL